MKAASELRQARILLGARGYQLVARVCGQGMALHEVAGSRKRERLTAADNLRACLDDLAVLWRLATRRNGPK